MELQNTISPQAWYCVIKVIKMCDKLSVLLWLKDDFLTIEK